YRLLQPTIRSIPRSRHNPKILRIDDAEIVGDRITEVRPIPRNFFTQETERVLPQADAGHIELAGFHNIRFWGDASAQDIRAIMMADAPKAETLMSLGAERHQPVSTLLAISGGAEDGAFGAGRLVGWIDAGTRPAFDLVTGVSSGALIAPFAFLGREHDNQLRE